MSASVKITLYPPEFTGKIPWQKPNRHYIHSSFLDKLPKKWSLVDLLFVSSFHIFSRVLRDSTPRSVGLSVGLSVRRSVRRSVRHTLLFLGFCGFWPHCSCPSDRMTSGTAPAHPPPTRDLGSRVSGLVKNLRAIVAEFEKKHKRYL